MNRQPDLFATTADINAPPATDPESMARYVRPRLAALLSQAQNADHMPWDEQRTRVNTLIFHNMANWLPEAERDTLRAQFVRELRRLGSAPCPAPADGAAHLTDAAPSGSTPA